MDIACPACSTHYVVPDSSIGANGRVVRCAKCRHSWFQEPPQLEATPAAPTVTTTTFAPPIPPQSAAAQAQSGRPLSHPSSLGPPPTGIATPPPRIDGFDDLRPPPPSIDPYAPAPPFRPRRNRNTVMTIVAAIVALLVLLAAATVAWFGPHAFAGLIGSSHATSPLMLQVVSKPERRTLATGNELFAVSGRIVNPTAMRQPVPDIRAELRDAAGHTVYGWTISAPVHALPPGGSADFDSAEVDVPRGSKALNLSFAGTDEH